VRVGGARAEFDSAAERWSLLRLSVWRRFAADLHEV
jgi:hypothetical protein